MYTYSVIRIRHDKSKSDLGLKNWGTSLSPRLTHLSVCIVLFLLSGFCFSLSLIFFFHRSFEKRISLNKRVFLNFHHMRTDKSSVVNIAGQLHGSCTSFFSNDVYRKTAVCICVSIRLFLGCACSWSVQSWQLMSMTFTTHSLQVGLKQT